MNTYELKEFIGQDIPPYAILSHTWGQEEVLYRDITEGNLRVVQKRLGFTKIWYCAEQAKQDGLSYCWVDTCCIDKSSSAELSEAINSMYSWYQQAAVCYVYLADVDEDPGPNPDPYRSRELMEGSRWFTRGWTLQELIAPRRLIFYSSRWATLGTKHSPDTGWALTLSRITGIPANVIRTGDLHNCCIAQRLSWAANRRTTRIEDRAYSLLGLLEVNIPLLYGEGEKAFARLQQQIMESSDDDSIFAWQAMNCSHATLRGLLARSPNEFGKCGRFRFDEQSTSSVGEFRLTQKGVRGTWRSIVPSNEYAEVMIVLNTKALVSRKTKVRGLKVVKQGTIVEWVDTMRDVVESILVKLAYLTPAKDGPPIMVRVDSGTLLTEADYPASPNSSSISPREWIVRQRLDHLSFAKSIIPRIAGFYMGFDFTTLLEECSPTNILIPQDNTFRFARKVVNTLLQDGQGSAAVDTEKTFGALDLVAAKFRILREESSYLMICGFNPSKTHPVTVAWDENVAIAPLQSWGRVSYQSENSDVKSRWQVVDTSLRLVDDELVICCSVPWEVLEG